MSELTKRILFAAVAIPVAIFIITGPDIIFALAVILLSSLAINEYYNISSTKGFFPNKMLGIIFSILIQSGFFYFYYNARSTEPFLFLLAAILLLSFVIMGSELWSNKTNAIANTATTISGIIYVSFSFTSLIALKSFDNFAAALNNSPISWFSEMSDPAKLSIINNDINWGLFILNIFITVWICDSAAYFTGKTFGKHKLFPRHSPKKTWEGAIGGFIFSVIAFPLVSYFFNPELLMIHAIISGILIGVFGQIGDLVESQFKRDSGVKDSSNLLPGHGGVLDRFDSVIFVSPLIYLYFIFFYL